MPCQDIKPGMAFRSALAQEDIFLFAFASSMFEGDGLYRRFNRVGGFIENGWYRFKDHTSHLQRAEEYDFVG